MITWIENPTFFRILRKLFVFDVGGLGVSVVMSMSVWSEKKKEETKTIHIHPYTHSLTQITRRPNKRI